MFSFIKAKLGIGKHLELIKEINHQKVLRHNIIKLKPSEDDIPSNIIYDANINQVQANIDALATSLSMLLRSLNISEIQPYKVQEMLQHPYPKEVEPIIYYANLNNAQLYNSFRTVPDLILDHFIDLKDIQKYINFMESSKFNKKFRGLYIRKIKNKLVNYLEKYDRSGAEYMDHRLQVDNYNIASAIQSITTLTQMVNIHRCLINRDVNPYLGTENKEMILMEHHHDSWLIDFANECDNFNAVVFIEGRIFQHEDI